MFCTSFVTIGRGMTWNATHPTHATLTAMSTASVAQNHSRPGFAGGGAEARTAATAVSVPSAWRRSRSCSMALMRLMAALLRGGAGMLDANAYAELAKQSMNVKPFTYGAIDPNLFHAIVTQAVPPAPGPQGGQPSPDVSSRPGN